MTNGKNSPHPGHADSRAQQSPTKTLWTALLVVLAIATAALAMAIAAFVLTTVRGAPIQNLREADRTQNANLLKLTYILLRRSTSHGMPVDDTLLLLEVMDTLIPKCAEAPTAANRLDCEAEVARYRDLSTKIRERLFHTMDTTVQ